MPKPADFMFINKDARSDSLSHSKKSERIRIHSHVQKGRRYKQSDGGIIRTTQLPLLQPGRRPSRLAESKKQCDNKGPTRDDSRAEQFLDTIPSCEISSSLTHKQRSLPSHDPKIDPLLQDYPGIEDKPPSLSPPYVPWFPATAEENFDPFDVTCIRVDEAVYSLLQYFLRRFHPNIWHLERAIRADHAYTFRYNAMSVVQGCMHDEYNMYALLAHMSSYMYGIEKAQPAGNWDYYMHKALKASQNYVQSGSPITGRMILNTFSLACAEWYRYNSHNAYVHFRAAKAMVDMIGGLEAIDAPVAELLLTGDAYVAGEMNLKPLWSASDFDNGDDHPMTMYALQELQNLLSGVVLTASDLLKSAHQNIIPPELRWVVLDLAVVLSVLRSLQGPDASEEGLHWAHIRSIAIRHRLLHMELDDPRSDAIRMAIVLWMFLCFTVSGRKRSVKLIAPFLHETLEKIAEGDWQGHEDIRTWVLTIGALCANVTSEEHTWFVEEIETVLDEQVCDSEAIFNTLLTLSERTFYHESAQRANLKALASDVHQVREMASTHIPRLRSASYYSET